MRLHEQIERYVGIVCEQIRWKKARPRVADELEGHIIDARDALLAQGLGEDDATERAITETGDAAELGTQLDRIHRPKPQRGMIAVTAALIFIGLFVEMFVFYYNDRSDMLLIRLFFTLIGVLLMNGTYRLDFTLLGKFPKTMFFTVVAVAVTGLWLSPKVNGTSYYTQYATLLFPLAFAAIIYAVRSKGYAGVGLCALVFAALGGIALMIPSMFGFTLFFVSGIALFSAAVIKGWFGVRRLYAILLMLVPVIILAVILLIRTDWYIPDRIAVAFDPSLDPQGRGYFGALTRELLGGAKAIGRGVIPEGYELGISNILNSTLQNNLLLTAVTVHLGWIWFGAIVCVLLVFIVVGFVLCLRQKSVLGLLISLSVILTFSLQAAGYVIYNLGFQLCSSISLPLISYGNAAMLINLALIGFMLSVFKTGDVVRDKDIFLRRAKL